MLGNTQMMPNFDDLVGPEAMPIISNELEMEEGKYTSINFLFII